MTSTYEPIHFSKHAVNRAFSKIFAIPGLGLIALLISAAFKLMQAPGVFRFWTLLFGSVLSILAWILFRVQVIRENGKTKRVLASMAIGFGMFVPYLFGCYLCFYEGIWRLFSLRRGFSLWAMILSLLFIFLGYSVVNGTYKATELAKDIDGGTICVTDE